jgi:hypothetical protein
VAALGLSGCATEADRNYADFKTCQARGTGPGVPGYSACRAALDSLHAADRQVFAARMQAVSAMGQSLRDTNTPPPVESAPSGFTKVCTYNTIMGPRAITVSAVSLCPLLPP